MPTSYTTLLGLAKPATGELTGTWGTTVNSYITEYLDAAVAGAQVISGSQTAVTLSTTNGSSLVQAGVTSSGSSQYAIIRCTGNPAGLLTITAPAASKTYLIINATSTSQSVKLVGAGPTTGVTIAASRAALVAWNGSDFALIATTDVSQLSGTLAVANGGTGATTLTGVLKGNGISPVTASNVNLASEVTGTLPVANGGTNASDAGTARTNLGLGSIATQAAGNVAITGGSITGITDLAVADGGTGASSITANRVILGNGSSALNGNLVAPGTSGNVLTSNGTTWASTALPAPATGPNAQVFTSSGTFTVPAGVTKVIVDVWGGGGGGANAFVGGTGSTGGSGGFGRAYISSGLGTSVVVTVGGGGNAGAGTSGGSAGGTSSFGTFISCTGGNPANGAGGGQSGVPTVSGATLLLKSLATSNPVSVPNGGATNGTTSVLCPCGTNYGRGGGGGMSGGGGGADNSAVRAGGSAFGAGADGAASTITNGGNGGGSNGGAGSVISSGYFGSGGGGTGGVIVYW